MNHFLNTFFRRNFKFLKSLQSPLLHASTGIERRYKDCGWKVIFFKEVAVTNRDGISPFFSDDNFKNLEWGASLTQGKRKTTISSKRERFPGIISDTYVLLFLLRCHSHSIGFIRGECCSYQGDPKSGEFSRKTTYCKF